MRLRFKSLAISLGEHGDKPHRVCPGKTICEDPTICDEKTEPGCRERTICQGHTTCDETAPHPDCPGKTVCPEPTIDEKTDPGCREETTCRVRTLQSDKHRAQRTSGELQALQQALSELLAKSAPNLEAAKVQEAAGESHPGR